MTLKQTIYNILLNNPECRDSDKLLQWEVLTRMSFVSSAGWDRYITKENFMKAPEFESIRRCRQDLQNLKKQDKSYSYEDKLLIQATPKVKKQRLQLSKEKGYQFIQGQFNPKTKVYEQY